MADLDSVDLGELLRNASAPLFLLNERHRLVFANPSLDQLLGVTRGDDAARMRLESELLQPPADLPDDKPRSGCRPWGEGKGRRWIALTFVPIKDASGTRIAVLGHAALADAPIDVQPAADALAKERLERLREAQSKQFGVDSIPARGEPMLRVMHQIKLAAASDTSLAFVGEAATGKKTLARALHFASERRRRNLAILDCRAETNETIRRQLVGEAVVSTEATARVAPPGSLGLLHHEIGGTLVLVGVASLSTDVQELLVRELAAAERPRWRIVATEREPLETCQADGRLVRSFYYLISRFVIAVPPLRERQAEFADLCQSIVERMRKESRTPISALSPDAVDVLGRYDWPGNLVELESVIHASARRSTKAILGVRDLPRRLVKPDERPMPELEPDSAVLFALDALLESVERRMVDLALRIHGGNKSKAAQSLGISRQRLVRRAGQAEDAADGSGSDRPPPGAPTEPI